jgi:plasmid stabilization system protein ParE
MTVAWSRRAMEDRTAGLVEAFERACEVPDPQLFTAAVERDEAIEQEGNALDGAALCRPGWVEGTFIYATRDGRHLIAYQREADEVRIDRALVTRRHSNRD